MKMNLKDIIEKVLSLYEKCPIKDWTDLGDEDATPNDIRKIQVEYILNNFR